MSRKFKDQNSKFGPPREEQSVGACLWAAAGCSKGLGERRGVSQVLCPIKSSKCLAFLNPGGRRGDLISEILGPSLVSRRLTNRSARGTGALSAPTSYASFLIVPLSDPLSSPTLLVPSIRCKYEASFSRYQKVPSEFLGRVIGTPSSRTLRRSLSRFSYS